MKEDFKTSFASVVKATFLTVVISLIGVLIFAFVVKFADLSDAAVKIVNQCIKVIAVFTGCYISLGKSKGLIKGATAGLVATAILYLVFSLSSGAEAFGVKTLFDMLFVAVIGGISGVIAVNLKRKD
ncbi:MAG: TIGR04086 family membrane protein [Clostridia bacterium]|nr:TIGR04086 family membrane protein [Clostridia bacterium]